MPLPPPTQDGIVRMENAASGAEEYATITAYRNVWYDKGWRSPLDDPDYEGDPATEYPRSIAEMDAALELILGGGDIGYDVVLLCGQSNMSGRGTEIDLEHLDPIDPRIFQYGNSGEWENVISQAVEPLAMHDTPSGMGPGIVFARWYLHMVPQNRRVLLVPTAHGATGFFNSTLTWDPDAADNSNNLYENAIDQCTAALAAAGDNARLVAILWHQGENDAGETEEDYAEKLDELIAGFRDRLDAPTVPFIVGRMVPEGIALHSDRVPIDAAHISTPNRVAFSAVADAPAGHNKPDNDHFKASGQRLLGRAYFDAYRLALLRTVPVPVGAPPAQITGLTSGAPGHDSVSLTWNADEVATLYTVEYKESASPTWLEFSSTTSAFATVTGLDAETSYDFRVHASNAAGDGPVSATYTVTTDVTPPGTPGQVVGLAATAETTTTITLDWDDLVDADSYFVEYRVTGTTTWLGYDNVDTSTVVVGGLLDDLSYDFRVTGSGAGGAGTPSSTVAHSTDADGSWTELHAGAAGLRRHSLRLTRAAYAGDCIKVRRSSDDTTQDIGFDGQHLDVAALLTFVGVGSGYVHTWYDQSGNGRDWVNATAAEQPRIVNAGSLVRLANGRPAVEHMGGQYLVNAVAGMYAAGALTALCVLEAPSGVSGMRVVAEGRSTVSSPQYSIIASGTLSGRCQVNIRSNTGAAQLSQDGSLTVFDDTSHQVTILDSGSNYIQRVDGASSINQAYTRSATTLDRNAAGALVRNTVGSFFTGKLAEFVAIGSVLSGGDYAAAEDNQTAYWTTP